MLNGDAAVAWGDWFQNLFQSGLADPQAPDDQAMHQGRAAMAYIGNWYYPQLHDAWGDDLVILPPPDFGNGPVVGGASWQWGISSTCENPDGAWAFISYLLQPENVAAMSDATGLIPRDCERRGHELKTMARMARSPSSWTSRTAYAMLRPPTPAYPAIASTFENAAREIALGADVQNTLDDAVDRSNRDIQRQRRLRLPVDVIAARCSAKIAFTVLHWRGDTVCIPRPQALFRDWKVQPYGKRNYECHEPPK